MRPVIRNTVYTYPTTINVYYQQDLDYLTNNGYLSIPLDSPPANFKTTDITKFLGEVTDVNDGKANWDNISAKGKLEIKFLSDNIFTQASFNPGASYGDQRGFLVNNFGVFCSYCGMRVNDTSLAVEHMLPKSVFPQVMMQINNLLLACSPCNSQNKGTQPNWSQCVSNVPPPASNQTYGNIKKYGILLYTWPVNTTITVASSNATAYSGFTAAMFNQTTANLIAPANSLSLNTVLMSVKDNQVLANIYMSPTSMVPTYVQVKYTGTSTADKNMIALVGLNNAVPGDPRVTDRRMVNRTVAWLNAISAFSFMNAIMSLPPTTPNKPAMVAAALQQMLSNASNGGFYEVWVGVLNYLSPVAVNSIYALFKAATNGDNLYFPGTDATLLP